MSLHIAIFEDDKDLADHLQELLEDLNYDVTVLYKLDPKANWKKVDVILADYRNQIVRFGDVVKLGQEKNVPVIAISGGDMDYKPCLQKPFSIEEMQSVIVKAMMKKANDEDDSLFSIFRSRAG